ncbi:hypothetical protein XENOCAPTIV_019748, partial [Xenoophorus captivus]
MTSRSAMAPAGGNQSIISAWLRGDSTSAAQQGRFELESRPAHRGTPGTTAG